MPLGAPPEADGTELAQDEPGRAAELLPWPSGLPSAQPHRPGQQPQAQEQQQQAQEPQLLPLELPQLVTQVSGASPPLEEAPE